MATYSPLQIAPDPTTQQTATAQPAAPKTPASTPAALPIGPTQQVPTQSSTQTPTAPANPVTPPPLATTDPMAFAPSSGGLPSGFSLGSGGTYGNAYYQGQQVNGLVNDSSSPTGYSYSFVNGSIVPGATQDAWQQIVGAENQNFYAPGNPGATNSTYGASGNPTGFAGLAANGGYSPLEATMPTNGGINGGGLPGSADPRLGLPRSTAPSGTPSMLETMATPMSIAGASPGAQGTDAGSGAPPTSTGSTGSGFLNGINSASGGNSLGYNLTPTDPNNALTSKTITPTNTDFMGQARSLLDSLNAANDSQYQANLRDANRYAYSQGRGGSGIENTSLGDIAQQHTLQQQALGQQLLYGALGQQNANNYANVGIAQQQQGFQNTQQQEAFNNALQQLLAGSSGDPSQIALILAQIYGSQAGGIGQAAQNYAGQQQANTNSQLQNQQFQQWLQAIMNGGGSSLPPNFPTTANLPGVQTTPGGGY